MNNVMRCRHKYAYSPTVLCTSWSSAASFRAKGWGGTLQGIVEKGMGISCHRLPKIPSPQVREPRKVYPSVTNRLSARKTQTQQLSQAEDSGLPLFTPYSVRSPVGNARLSTTNALLAFIKQYFNRQYKLSDYFIQNLC